MDHYFSDQMGILDAIEKEFFGQPMAELTEESRKTQFSDLEFQIVQLLSNHKDIYNQLNLKLKFIEEHKAIAENHIAQSKGKHYVMSSLNAKYESSRHIPEVTTLRKHNIDSSLVDALEHGAELKTVDAADSQIAELLNQEYQVRSLETQEIEI